MREHTIRSSGLEGQVVPRDDFLAEFAAVVREEDLRLINYGA